MTEKPLPPPHHSWIETEDGSLTLFSDYFQESCHSTSGAKAETILHYFNGCEVDKKINTHSPLNILEVGFGLGVGFLTTYELLPKNKNYHFVSLELDKNLLEWFKEQHLTHEFLKNLKWVGNILSCENEFIKLTILCGDARITFPRWIKNEDIKFQAIYQDAFSPKRNPILWTKEWFELLKSSASLDVILSTYSASSSIRKSLHETGWSLRPGDKFGTKRTSTRAYLDRESDPEILEQLKHSPVPALTDLQISSLNSTIKE